MAPRAQPLATLLACALLAHASLAAPTGGGPSSVAVFVDADNVACHAAAPTPGTCDPPEWLVRITGDSVNTTLPAPAVVELPGAGEYSVALVQLPGWHVYSASHTGGRVRATSPMDMILHIDDGSHVELRLAVQPIPASLDVVTYFDSNGNGGRDQHELPQPHVLVCLSAAGTAIPSDDDTSNCQRTDHTGAARWDGLPAGDYIIRLPISPLHALGLNATTATRLPITLSVMQVHTASFGTGAACVGLPLRFWQHWRQRYDDVTFLSIISPALVHVPAPNRIATADMLLAGPMHDPDDAMLLLRARVLSATLTMHVSQQTHAPASLFPGCRVPGNASFENPSLDTLDAAMLRALQLVQHPLAQDDAIQDAIESLQSFDAPVHTTAAPARTLWSMTQTGAMHACTGGVMIDDRHGVDVCDGGAGGGGACTAAARRPRVDAVATQETAHTERHRRAPAWIERMSACDGL